MSSERPPKIVVPCSGGVIVFVLPLGPHRIPKFFVSLLLAGVTTTDGDPAWFRFLGAVNRGCGKGPRGQEQIRVDFMDSRGAGDQSARNGLETCGGIWRDIRREPCPY